MRKRWLVSLSLLAVVSLALGTVCFVTADEKPKTSESRRVDKRLIAPKAVQFAGTTPDAKADEAEVRALGEAVMQAYRHHQAQEFAAAFTADGEYLDSRETLFHGREAIAKEFGAFFQANPEATISVKFDVLRPIAQGVVKVQGTTSFWRTPSDQPSLGRCILVCVKEGRRWLIASLREIESGEEVSHHEQIKPLEWMVGEWLSEGSQSEIHFSCRWDQDGNFLLREFSIHTAGRKLLSGTQRIGYDPLSGQLKIWIFDSHGGYSHGYVSQQGDGWVVHTSGVTASGQSASGNEIFTPLDPHRITWESVDRIVAGDRIPDTGKITLVRKPPAPAAASASNSKSQPQ